MTLWIIALAIGALFGWCWGWTAGQRSVLISLPVQAEGLSGVGTEKAQESD